MRIRRYPPAVAPVLNRHPSLLLANVWLSDERYGALRHRLEDAHASVEAAAVEARRRVRLNEGRE